ncbi:alpha/beta hydrolase family protein [Ceratobasidium sp. AG-Ba]|nr:alpha/beta hydrolase family protein [Ceratobasidium sp. AG-Ba]
MVLFPPFLREGAHRKKQEPNSTHHCAIFSHNSPSIVGDADIEWWPVDATQEQSEQSIPDFVFLFIPGNPGLVEFYTEFLDDIHRDISKTGKRLEIFVRGHIGQAPNLAPAKNALWSVGLEAQVMSVVELYDSIQDTYGPTVKVILGGHSVGAWIVTQVMHSRPNTAAAAFLLFPTWLFHRPIPTVVSSFTAPISSASLSRHTFPPLSLEISRVPIFPVGSSLGSAPSTVQATCERERHRTYACFAAKDEWVGDEIESVRKMLDEGKVVVRDDDVPHAFCIMPLSQKFA